MTKEQPQAVNPETQELLKRVYRLKEDLHYEVRRYRICHHGTKCLDSTSLTQNSL